MVTSFGDASCCVLWFIIVSKKVWSPKSDIEISRHVTDQDHLNSVLQRPSTFLLTLQVQFQKLYLSNIFQSTKPEAWDYILGQEQSFLSFCRGPTSSGKGSHL